MKYYFAVNQYSEKIYFDSTGDFIFTEDKLINEFYNNKNISISEWSVYEIANEPKGYDFGLTLEEI